MIVILFWLYAVDVVVGRLVMLVGRVRSLGDGHDEIYRFIDWSIYCIYIHPNLKSPIDLYSTDCVFFA